MKKVKEFIKKSLEDLPSKYEYIITTDNELLTIKIATKYSECFGCKCTKRKELLRIRQDKRVQNLFVPKRFCKSCVKVVDELISNLKEGTPQHLQNLL